MIRRPYSRMFGRRRAATIVGVALVASFLTACGSGGGSSSAGSTAGAQSATRFVRQITTEFARGQAGRLWDTLHPADQAIVTRDRYSTCQTNSGFDLKSFKVLETYADPVTVGGKSTPATAISVQVTSDDGVTTATMHAIRVKGGWRWILSPADYAAYKQGKCPPTSSG